MYILIVQEVKNECFGRNDMYWYRMVTGFKRCSIVGTTVKNPECLPKDVVADEKHTSLKEQKVYGAKLHSW